MADRPTEKPAPPPVPARPVARPGPAAGPLPVPEPAVPPDSGAAPASVRDSLKSVQRRPAPRPTRVPRPTSPPPVRDIAPPAGVSTPRREVTVDDQVWVLRQKGAGCVGYDRDSAATILSIGLEPPGNRDDPSAIRYVLARTLDDVAEEELVSLVREVARAPDAGTKGAGETPRGHPPRSPSRPHARQRRGRKR